MEYINIISKEEVAMAPAWIICLICGLGIAAVASVFVYWAIVKDVYKVIKYEYIVGFSAIVFVFIGYIFSSIFFRVPTGRYKYEATIDRDKITVAQYEEFIEEYNPTIKDGVYYWID